MRIPASLAPIGLAPVCLAIVLMAYSGTALAQGIVVPAKMEIFDGVSKSSHKENGRLIVDDFYAIDSRFQLQTAGGKTICSGTRRQGNGGGTFAGKCFGYKARGNYTQDARGNVRMRWDYSNSWIKMNAKVQ